MEIQTMADAAKVSCGLSALSVAARRDLNAELEKIDCLTVGGTLRQATYWAAAQELFTVYGMKYGQASQALALDVLDAHGIPLRDVPNIMQAFYPDRIIREAYENGLPGYLGSAMDIVVKRGYRQMIQANADRWARVPTSDCPCPWCVMLASRGFVYKTREKAMAAYHTSCHCLPVPAKDAECAFVEGYDPGRYYDLYREGKGIGNQLDKDEAWNTNGKPLRSENRLFQNLPSDTVERSRVIDNALGNYSSRGSKWSGNIVTNDKMKAPRGAKALGLKLPNCDIALHPDADTHVRIHEHLHARSASYYGNSTYKANQRLEEGVVDLYAREICKINRVPYKANGYDGLVANLRAINHEMAIGKTDLIFARKLFDVGLPDRHQWLQKKLDKYILDHKVDATRQHKLQVLVNKTYGRI